MVATEYEHYMHFEDDLRDDLQVLIAPQRKRDFAVLVEKPKIAEDVKRTSHQNREKDKGRNKRARQPALVYAARHREDGDAPDVIASMFFIHNVPYTLLIDVGSTHSYVACTVSKKLGVMCQNTTSEVTVLSPLGQSIRVNKLFKDVPLEVQGMIFLANLMELPFGEFDIILGMDWLVKH
ncbi:uncharacterized protein [Gossypium hirsutum]|uniref:Protein DDI1 homolog 2-like n=1 Tax=Gossypium hirsutum TaxID=3635 RepID=A0A1U8PVF7_GOSHI|nr:uncharacterized protein LOC107963046 [Gossypium hirsutum]